METQFYSENYTEPPLQRSWLPWVILVAAFILAVWLFVLDGTETIKGWFKKSDDNSDDESGTATVKTSSSTTLGAVTFPLSWGSKGVEVKKLQQVCLDNGIALPKYGADGTWGQETEEGLTALRNLNKGYERYIDFLQTGAKYSGSHWQVASRNDYNSIVNLKSDGGGVTLTAAQLAAYEYGKNGLIY